MAKALYEYRGISVIQYFYFNIRIAIFAVIIALITSGVQAQSSAAQEVDETAAQLESIQLLIDVNVKARSVLRAKIQNAAPDELPELQQELGMLNDEIKKQQFTFEQLAIGAVDVAVLGEIDTSFDWRDEVSQIMQPIVANLKALTDKPRKISKLQTLIEQNQLQSNVIDTALEAIAKNMSVSKDAKTVNTLSQLQRLTILCSSKKYYIS